MGRHRARAVSNSSMFASTIVRRRGVERCVLCPLRQNLDIFIVLVPRLSRTRNALQISKPCCRTTLKLIFARYQGTSRSNGKRLLLLDTVRRRPVWRKAPGTMTDQVFLRWMRRSGPNQKQHQSCSNSLPPKACTTHRPPSGKRCILQVVA
jgi:hypothetical protein